MDSMEQKKRSNRTNKVHQKYMVDFIENHPEMMNTNFAQPMARQNYNKLWQELTISLNAMGMGEKCATQWQKVLSDCCTKTKSKASMSRNYLGQTGGGPKSTIELSDLEIRLMALKGWSSVYAEAGFGKVSFTKQLPEHNKNVIIEIEEGIVNFNENICNEIITSNLEQEHADDSMAPYNKRKLTPSSSKLKEMPATITSDINTKVDSTYSETESPSEILLSPHIDILRNTRAPKTPTKKIDMETMHCQTLNVWKEINNNLKGVNDRIQGIENAVNEQTNIFKQMCDLITKNVKE